MTAVTNNTSTGATSNSTSSSSSGTSAKEISDRFLKMLVAQMQNQDPMNPMDNSQVTAQMAQINTVSGIEQLNSTVQSLSSQFTQMQVLQGTSLIGRSVEVEGNDLTISNKAGEGGYTLGVAADDVQVTIYDANNNQIGKLDLGKQTAGRHDFSWPAGNHKTADGLTFKVSAVSGNTAISATPLMRDTVDAVSTSGDTLTLELTRSGNVAYSDVKAFD